MEDLKTLFQSNNAALWLALSALLAVAFVWILRLQIDFSRMKRHYRSLASGVETGNLEQILDTHLAHLYNTSSKVEELVTLCNHLNDTQRRSVQRIGIVRFNPFNDTGGDQSFAIALLNGSGDGLVISSLFSRTGNRIFAKSILQGRSKYPLTAEEEQAIIQANSTALDGSGD